MLFLFDKRMLLKAKKYVHGEGKIFVDIGKEVPVNITDVGQNCTRT